MVSHETLPDFDSHRETPLSRITGNLNISNGFISQPLCQVHLSRDNSKNTINTCTPTEEKKKKDNVFHPLRRFLLRFVYETKHWPPPPPRIPLCTRNTKTGAKTVKKEKKKNFFFFRRVRNSFFERRDSGGGGAYVDIYER